MQTNKKDTAHQLCNVFLEISKLQWNQNPESFFNIFCVLLNECSQNNRVPSVPVLFFDICLLIICVFFQTV